VRDKEREGEGEISERKGEEPGRIQTWANFPTFLVFLDTSAKEGKDHKDPKGCQRIT